MSKIIRIGGGAGAFIDSTIGAPQLIADGVDYIIFDYMAELATQLFARERTIDPEAGFSKEFTDWIWKDNVAAIAEKGVKIIASAGGLNARGCRARMEAIAAEAGVSLRIAVIEGDDVVSRFAEFEAQGVVDMFTGTPFPGRSRMKSANAYVGASAVASALAAGADVVITGRVADSALALGPLMHEFGWGEADHDLLAAGSLAGHIIECGPQATGAIFTDWRDVSGWDNIGYPIVECSSDGDFVVTKPRNSGGLVSVGTVAEQMLYEIGDPAAYILPDVVCDFTAVTLTQVAPDRVAVTGARGNPATTTFKVCGTYTDGFRAVAVLPILGEGAVEKAERQAQALFDRVDAMLEARGLAPFNGRHFEVLGAETTYGARARTRHTREVVLKIAVEHHDMAAIDVFQREARSPLITMAPGNTGWFPGQPAVSPVVRLFSHLVSKQDVVVSVDFGNEQWMVPVAPGMDRLPSPSGRTDPAASLSINEAVSEVPLSALAFARSGDKGDDVNIAVIAREPEFLPYLRAVLTEHAMAAWFVHDFDVEAGADRVRRYDVPGVHALNFVLHGVLGGGAMASMRLDAMGKGKAQQLLDMVVPVPAAVARDLGLSR